MAGNKEAQQIAKRLRRLETRVRRMARGSQASFRSVELTDGPQSFYDEDGVERLRFGAGEDGVYTISEMNGGLPPQPSPPDVVPVSGGFNVVFDGTFEYEDDLPLDFLRYEVHLGPTPGYAKNDTTQIASFVSPDGGVYFYPWNSDSIAGYVAIVAVNRSEVESVPSSDVPAFGIEINDNPTAPPALSPPVEVTGTADALIIDAQGLVAPSTNLTYQMSMDYDPDTMIGTWADLPNMPTKQTIVIAFTEPDGDPLVPDVVYYVRVIASNIIDDAVPSEPIAGSLDLSRVTETVTGVLRAGVSEVGRLEVGPGYWDPNEGLKVPQTDQQYTLISSNPAVPSNWAGKVNAFFLTLKDGVLNGLFEVFGTQRLLSGVSKPKTGPEVADYWPTFLIPKPAGYTDEQWAISTGGFHGLTDTADGLNWVTTNSLTKSLQFYPKNGDAPWEVEFLSTEMPWGVTRIGSDFYVCYLNSQTVRWYIAKCSTSAVVDRSSVSYVVTGNPCIGNDGTNPLFAGTVGGDTMVRTVDLDLNGHGAAQYYDTFWNSNPDLAYVGKGTYDWGVTRTVFMKRSGSDPFRVMTSTTVRDSAKEWTRAYNNATMGMLWDGTRFFTMNTSGTVYQYSTQLASTLYHLAHAWLSSDGTKETEVSPIVTHTRPARAMLLVTMPAPPEFGLTDLVTRANRLAVYAGTSAVTLKQQSELIYANQAYVMDAHNAGGKAPEATSQFIGISAPGRIESEDVAFGAPKTRFIGNGDFALTGLNFFDSGELVPTGSWSGYLRFQRIGTMVFVEGYIDRDDSFGTSATTIAGITIPTWAVPSSNRQMGLFPGYDTNEEYRYSFLTDGTVTIQRTGIITTFMKVAGHYNV